MARQPDAPDSAGGGGMKIAIATVMLSKREHLTTAMTHTLCWREGVSDRDAMRGIAVEHALEAKPGFSVDSVLVEIITVEPKP